MQENFQLQNQSFYNHIYERESELKTLALIIIAKWTVLLNIPFVDCNWQLWLLLQYKFHF